MARDAVERDQQQHANAPQAQEEAPRQQAVDDPAWAAGPEAATAKEAARVPETPATEAAGQLEGKVNLPSPVDAVLAQMPLELPPDAIEEMRAQETTVRRNALARAYEAVMTGSAAAAGNPKAQAALAGGPPQMAQLAQDVKQDTGGGGALPVDVRETMEAKFGQDFSDVKVVAADDRVGQMQAGAATHDEVIHFAPGRFDPQSTQGQALIAHELTHVVQQRGGMDDKAQVAASNSAAEVEASAVQEAVHAGGQVPAVQAGTAAESAVHLGEAGVHQGIELEAAGVIAPGTDPHKRYDPDNLTPDQQHALEMYAGNFMRDFSQFQVPKALNYLSKIPSATGPDGHVGANGAVALADAVVQCIGILELGVGIGTKLVTPQNIGVYEAEHHIDNPMGTSGGGDYITRSTNGGQAHTAASPEMKCIETVDARGDQITVDTGGTTDKDTAATHAGSAVNGLQYENPSLYEVGSGGLANHISNSTEHCKDRFLDATRLGPTPEGRMNVGMGSHIIEDYFSHSNYIEVAMNRYINDAVNARKGHQDAAAQRAPESRAAVNAFFDNFIDAEGKPKDGKLSEQQVNGQFAFVDSLYDQQDKNGRQAVTTGTFGGTDTMVSLGHVLLPRLPVLETALHKGVDSIFGVVQEAAKKKDNPPTWDVIQGLLDGKGRNGAIAKVMLNACETAGLAVPCPSGFHFTMKELGSLPLIGAVSVPNGVQLDYTNIPITGAITTGAATYASLMKSLDEFEQWAGIAAVRTAIEAIKAAIKAAMDALANAIRQQVSSLIAGMIQELFNVDPKKAGHAGVAELASLAEEGMHELEEKTSMETRLQAGGDLQPLTEQGIAGKAALEARVGPVRPRDPNAPNPGSPGNPWVTVNPLPPSHSEISKDHPPHKADDGHPEWHGEGKEKEELEKLRKEGWDKAMGHENNEEEDEHGHEHLHGSSFYELHYQLALEADRHMQEQLSVIWGQTVTGHDPSIGAILDSTAMLPTEGPEEAWVTAARGYNAQPGHAEHVATFNAATGNQCLGGDGMPDPSMVKQWQEAKGLSGDGKIGPQTARAAEELGPASSLTPMAKGDGADAVSHASMLRAASGVAGVAGQDAGAAHMRHAQTDPRLAAQMENADVRNLLNLVDYFMSHPAASQWWVGIFDSYVSQHAEDVYGSILARNQTRSRRGKD